MKLTDVLSLMAGMAQHKIGVLEMPGLKLVLSPDRISSTAAAGNISPMPGMGPEQMQMMQAARVRAQQLAEQKAAELQARTLRARGKATGTVGASGPGKLANDIYEQVKKSAPKPNAS